MNKHILEALSRRVSTFLLLTLCATQLFAQYYMDIHQSSGVSSFLISNVDTVKYEADKNGIYSMEVIRKNSAPAKVRVSEIDSVKIYSKSSTFGYVDLGLSVLWATYNVGATAPSECGSYYAWGETDVKDVYSWRTYKWCEGTSTTLTKYNTSSSFGVVDGKMVLEPDDDVAHVQWGGDWRMPTNAEFNELINNCTWKKTTINGIEGYQVTSNVPGYTNNSIFFPSAGFKFESIIASSSAQNSPWLSPLGYYWSSSLGYEDGAWYILLSGENNYTQSNVRKDGRSVRPVRSSEDWLSTISLEIDTDTLIMSVGDSFQLNSIVKKNGDEIYEPVSWSSDNQIVAVVNDSGKVFAHSIGTALIKASLQSLSAQCVVIVDDGLDSFFESITDRIPTNEIWYTSTDGKIIEPKYDFRIDATIESNTYENGKGILKFKTPVTKIDAAAFSECIRLTSISIPRSVSSIGNGAFNGCGITSLFIPKSVDDIGVNPFERCSALSSIRVSSKNKKYDSRNNCNAIIETKTNKLVTGCKNTVIPLDISEIGYNAFYGCDSLSSITIPESVVEIGSGAFEDCTALTSITIPEGVKTIGSGAFWGCIGLESVTIPKNVTSIGLNPFSHCSNLISISVDPENTVYDSRNNCNAIIEKIFNTVKSGCRNTVIPSDTYYIGPYAFGGCVGLTSLNIPESVTIIGYHAFDGCSGLTSLTIPDGVTSISFGTFEGCSSLTSINIPEGVTSIGNNAFRSCKSLKSLTIPEGVTSIGEFAFNLCSSLKSIVIPNTVDTIGRSIFWDCSSLSSITLSEKIKSIGSDAFYRCRSLKSLTIPESVTTIGEFAFYGCDSLESLYFLSTVPPNVRDAYLKGTNNCPIYVPAESVEAYKSAQYWSNYAERIQAISQETPGFDNNHAYVDLGLSVMWATCNVGAEKPEDYGDYFAWGEVEPYYEQGYAQSIPSVWKQGINAGYDWSEYKYCEGSEKTLNKYCTDANYGYNGFVDNIKVLEPEDDVAHMKWGGDWRMPTSEEFKELVDTNNCIWTKNSIQGVEGFTIKSKINGNTIYLPIAGMRYFNGLYGKDSHGAYWSSSLNSNGFPRNADDLTLYNQNHIEYYISGSYRYYGLPVRPARPSNKYIPERVTSIKLSIKEFFIGKGAVKKISGTPKNSMGNTVTANVQWRSSDESVAKVSSDGQITAVGAGTCEITAFVDSIVNSCIVTVPALNSISEASGFDNGCGYVDMGLSVKWATFNVGASSPEGYGDYYTWGETETYYEDGYAQSEEPVWKSDKGGYNWSTYKYCAGSQSTITKYCSDGNYGNNGFTDSVTVLEVTDDVAYVKWGEDWRIPTQEQFEELAENCVWIWSTFNGVNGYILQSKINGNTIFIPASGLRGAGLQYVGAWGRYWTSTQRDSYPPYGSAFAFDSDKLYYGWGSASFRSEGFTIRPVYTKQDTVPVVTTIPNNEIWYTTTDGAVVTPYDTDAFGNAAIVSNTYENGKGVMTFNLPVTNIGVQAFYSNSKLESVSLPEGCKVISGLAFESCISLKHIALPSTLREIGGSAFYYCCMLEEVTLPDSLKYIGDAAFCRCEKLKEITIPESVVSIGGHAFGSSGITMFKGKFADASGKYLTDGESLIAVAQSDSSRFTIPAGIKNILDGVFYSSKFSEIILPEGLQSIGSQTFGDCDSLIAITVPNSVTTIDKEAFRYCDNLMSISLPTHISILPWGIFNSCKKLRDFVIPDSVTSIASYAFEDCRSLSKIVIPEKVTKIGDNAFDNCSSLDSIIVLAVQPPVGGNRMFDGTNNCLIYVPSNAVNAYKTAEYWSNYADRIQAISQNTSGPALTHEYVDLGLSVLWATCNVGADTPEGYGDYFSWGEIETYYEDGYSQSQNPVWKDGKSSGYNWSTYKYSFGSSGKMTKYCLDASYGYNDFVDNKKELDPEDDAASTLWGGSWRVPSRDEWDELKNSCSWIWTTLNGVKGYKVTSLVAGFENSSIFLPAAGWRMGVELSDIDSIGHYWINEVEPPSSFSRTFCIYPSLSSTKSSYGTARDIGQTIRPVCADTNSVTIITDSIPHNEIWYTSTDGAVVTPYDAGVFGATIVSNTYVNGRGIIQFDSPISGVGFKAFYQSNNLRTISLPEGCTQIGSMSFEACYSLTHISIPSTVKAIGSDAFYFCMLLENVSLPQSLQTIMQAAFCGCEKLKEITIPESVVSIGGHAFSSSGITTFKGKYADVSGKYLSDGESLIAVARSDSSRFTIPAGIKNILDGVFYSSKFSEIILPEGLRSIGKQTFGDCDSLTTMVVPNSVTAIASGAFRYCDNLTTVILPKHMQGVNWELFNGCSKLTNFVIPDSVSKIENFAFLRCVKLSSIVIPEKVTQIGGQAFDGCSGLDSIVVLAVQPPVGGENMFRNTNDCPIYVPAGSVNAYKSAEYWSNYADRIQAIPCSQPNNEIWYTSTDGKIVTPNRSNVFGATIVSNTYENGKGIIKFDSPVKSIGDNAFARRDSLSSIMIPDSVKIIERYAFSGCGNLTSMSISKSVSSIGECAFESCYKLSSVTIPEGVTNIGRGAFMGCRNLSSLDLSKTISYIGDYAFSNCQSLTSLIFPEGIDSLGMNPFRGCNNVESISVAQGNTVYDSRNGCNAVIETATNKLVLGCKNTVIPVEVTAIGDLAFYGSGITSCTIPNGVTSIGLGAFFGCSGLSSLIITEGVESIGMAAWGYCTGLTSISVAPGNAYYDSRNNCNAIIETATGALVAGCNNTILPPDITAIGGYALCGISGIDTLVIPAGVLTIEEGAFAESPDLKSLIIPEGVTSIGGMALGDCSGLKSLIIPSSVTSIGDGVFNRCSSLENITFLSTVPPAIGEIVFQSTNNCPIYVPSSSLAAYKAAENWSEYADRIQANPNQQPSNEIWYTSNNGQIVTPNQSNVFGATIVSNTYENGKGILKFDGPVTAVGNQAFMNCRGLKTIAIPDSVTDIDNYAFYYCDNLSEITMPDEVITIGNYAFNNCKNITSFIFPDSVTKIGAYAFNGCSSLSSLIIPAKVNEIGNDAFDGCRSLNSIIVAAGNKVYDSRDNCNAVIRIQTKSLIVGCKNTIIPSTVKTIGYNSFDGQSDLSSITIPEGVSKIESSAFRNTGLTSLSVPVSITNISGSAFRECVKLSTISVAAGNTKYDSRNDCNAIVETSTNKLVVGCKNTVIPSTVTSIGSDAFYGCDSLTSIVIPETVISIGSSAFYGCKGLASISIPSSITSISDYAFANCSGITSLTLPQFVEKIGSYAFSNCKGLTSVVIPSGVTNMSYDVFYNCSNLEYLEFLPVVPPVLAGSNPFRETNYCLLYVPEESVDAYKAATYWSDYANRIVAIPERQPNNEIWYTSTNGNAVSPNRTDVFGATIQSNTYENGKGVLRFDSPITIIGNSAFEGCGNLLTLSIPESVSNIGANAFADCDMMYIKILNTTPASLGTDAFDNNNCALYVPLESKYFYKVADGWRANISALQVIPEQQVPDNEIWYTTTDNSVVSINYDNCFGANIVSNTYENGKGIIRFDGAVTMLGDENSHSSSTGAFSFVRNLKTITLPNSVKKIGTCSFLGCWGLKKIQFPEHLDFLANGFCEETAIEELFIPETSIIYSCSFAGNSKLKKVTGPYASPDGKWLIKGDSLLTVFLRDDALITVPDGVAVLCQYAFGLCTKVQEVELPSSVRVIESSCFLSRRTLTKIDIPESVTRIGSFAFEDCIGLTSLVVPGNVSSIDNGAFRGCTQLTNIKFLSTTPPSVVGDILDNTNNCPIYVPAGSVDAYKAASGWSTYADRIQAIPQENTNNYEYVDLGLSVKWATFNVGATAPEEYGDYFAWGETETYYEAGYAQESPQSHWKEGKTEGYGWWTTYKWSDGSYDLLTKYNTSDICGTVDDKTVLDPEDDVAHVQWGGSWRMPTDAEVNELFSNCMWNWTTVNGVNGYLVTSNKPGYTDRSIFLPAASFHSFEGLGSVGSCGSYWSSSLHSHPDYARGLYFFGSNTLEVDHCNRSYGLTVRPVCP